MEAALPRYSLSDLNVSNPAPIDGLYVHVPFCFHKCHYCDFYSITRQTPGRMREYVDRVLAEADQWVRAAPGDPARPRTVFFGGGTPTLLPIEMMRRLIEGLRARFDCADVDEWTIEANPATVTPEYCEMLAQSGVNRLSFGAQSFSRAELKMLERHHDPEDVPRSLAIVRAAGFSRLNLDLIYAIPGQKLEDYAESLESAVAMGTEHLSCYGLTYEPNTPITVKKQLGQLLAVGDEQELEMLWHSRRRLADAGLPPYEISNYAIPGAECRHNLMYWNGGNYVGLGPSAASHLSGVRWKNAGNLDRWESAIDRGELPAVDVERLTGRQRAGELAMLRLRLSDGIDFEQFQRICGLDARVIFADPLDRLGGAGLIERDDRGVRVTDKGLNVADAIAGEFLG